MKKFNKDILDKVVELSEQGKNKGQIEGFLMFQHELSTNESKAYVKEAGINSTKPKSDLTVTVKVLRESVTAGLSKAEIIDALCKANGLAKRTNEAYYTYINMAKEWSKQDRQS